MNQVQQISCRVEFRTIIELVRFIVSLTFKLLNLPIFWICVTLPVIVVMKFKYIMSMQLMKVVTIDDDAEIVADVINESVVDVVNENVVETEIDVNEGGVDAN